MRRKKTKQVARGAGLKSPKKANSKRRRKPRRGSKAVIHQGILTDEQLAYL